MKQKDCPRCPNVTNDDECTNERHNCHRCNGINIFTTLTGYAGCGHPD